VHFEEVELVWLALAVRIGLREIVERRKKSRGNKEKRTKKIMLSGSQIFLCAAMMNQKRQRKNKTMARFSGQGARKSLCGSRDICFGKCPFPSLSSNQRTYLQWKIKERVFSWLDFSFVGLKKALKYFRNIRTMDNLYLQFVAQQLIIYNYITVNDQ